MARGRSQRTPAGDRASGLGDADRDRQIVESLVGGGVEAGLSSLSQSVGFSVPAPSAEGGERALELARALVELHQGAWPERLPFVRRGLDLRASDIEDLCAGRIGGDRGERALARVERPGGMRSTDPEPSLNSWIARCRDIMRAPDVYPTLPQLRASQDSHRRLFVPLSPAAYTREFLPRFGSMSGVQRPGLGFGPDYSGQPRSLYLAHEIADYRHGEDWQITCLVSLGKGGYGPRHHIYLGRRLNDLGPAVKRLFDPERAPLRWNGASHMPILGSPEPSQVARLGSERCRHASGRWDAYGPNPGGFRLSCHDCLRRTIAFMPLHRAPSSMLSSAGESVRQAISNPNYAARERFYRRLSGEPVPEGDDFQALRSLEWIMDPRPARYAITSPARALGLPIDQALETRRRAERPR